MLKLEEETSVIEEPKPKRHRVLPLWYLLGWIIAALVAAAKIRLANPPIADDAYITLRYSYNLIHYGVFTYNYPSAHLAGAETSPLYGLLLAPLLRFFTPVQSFNIVMVVSVASSAVLLFELIKREWGGVAGLLASLILLLNDYLYATRGMETSLFIFACLAAILLLHSVAKDLIDVHKKARLGKALAAGFILAIAVFIRGDAAILLLFPAVELILGIGRNYKQAKYDERLRLQDPYAFIEPEPRLIRSTFETAGKPFKTFFAFLFGIVVVAAPMAYLLKKETGKIIPGTLLAKAAQARSGFWGRGWLYYTDMEDFIRTNPWQYEIYALAALAVLGLIVVFASRSHWKNRPLTFAIIGFAVLQLIAYGSVLIVPFYYWCMGPQIIAVSALAAIAVGVAVTKFRSTFSAKMLAVPAIALFAYFAYSVTLIGPSGFPWRQNSYMQAAAWPKANTPPNATVAATEIGYLGYLGYYSLCIRTEALRSG